MAKEKVINFGYYIRHLREKMQLSRTHFIAKAGIALSERRLWQIEMDMPKPKVQSAKYEAIAKALGLERDALERKWQSTPVPRPDDEGKTRKRELEPVAKWVSAEAQRIGVDRGRAAKLTVKLLEQFEPARRDEIYGRKASGDDADSMKMPQAKKDGRMRAAAKPLGAKAPKA